MPNGYNQRHGSAGGKKIKPAAMNERIKQLRKSALHLTQAKFGEKIGVGQQSVANIENGGTVTERNFDAICRAFNVNPEWLRDGVGEMFLPNNVDTYLDKVAAKNNLTTEDKALIKSMLELPPEARKAFVDWAEKLVDEIYSPATGKGSRNKIKSPCRPQRDLLGHV